ncbi:OmpA family protein [Paracoccus methylovorus]|uniref:OmpA family protein n=2 Tax=Paracoccaceae TaxID=31989 RepID=A0ABX7JJG4_9RHOB|nr:OmpA family protein [Paracoccus methylovorus]
MRRVGNSPKVHRMASPQQSARRPARRSPVIVTSMIAIVAAAGLSFLGARAAADFIEANAAQDLRAALADYDWVQVTTDGLQVQLEGIAPDEVQRFRARARAETVVDAGRVIDRMQVAASAELATPAFGIELLRNDQSISIIGLVPSDLDRNSMVERLKRQTGAAQVSDLMESADYPVPDGWKDAFSFGLSAAQLAKRAKVSISAGEVSIRAITDNPREKLELEKALNRAKPAGITLTADITAPRPVIAPFTLRFVKDATGARFDACAADTETARDRILEAGQAAGVPAEAQCTLGLGAPSPRWADAAVPAIRAVEALGAGSVTISDTDVALFAPAEVETAMFDDAAGRLEALLPPAFTLVAQHQNASEAEAGPAEFSAVVDPGGVSLRGRITDERMRDAVESLARARFGQVDSTLRSDASVPEGWTLRAIAALEALDGLERGEAKVTRDLVRISGVSGNQTASDLAAARLAQRLGAGARYELAIRYDRRKDPLLGLPSGIECVDRLNAVMQQSEIGFEPNKSVIAGDPGPTLSGLAETMAQCSEFRIEIGGHTDSQGSEGFNAELSRARAQAVLAAMTEAGIDTTNMTAKGYGESQPIADNDTDAGREANRRIEFLLLADDPVMVEAPAPAELVKGVTDSAEVVAARTQAAALHAATAVIGPALGVPTDPEAAMYAATEPLRVLLSGIDLSRVASRPVQEAVLPELPALRAATLPVASLLPEGAEVVGPVEAATRPAEAALVGAAINAATIPARDALHVNRPLPRPESPSTP